MVFAKELKLGDTYNDMTIFNFLHQDVQSQDNDWNRADDYTSDVFLNQSSSCSELDQRLFFRRHGEIVVQIFKKRHAIEQPANNLCQS